MEPPKPKEQIAFFKQVINDSDKDEKRRAYYNFPSELIRTYYLIDYFEEVASKTGSPLQDLDVKDTNINRLNTTIKFKKDLACEFEEDERRYYILQKSKQDHI